MTCGEPRTGWSKKDNEIVTCDVYVRRSTGSWDKYGPCGTSKKRGESCPSSRNHI